jgi:hypothetical protein
MNTSSAYAIFHGYVIQCIKSRTKAVRDVSQSVWMELHQVAIPDDLTQAKKLIAVITARLVVNHIQSTLGRTGKRSAVNSGIVTVDTAEFILDQASDTEWLASYPESLPYLAAHLARGGSARELYPTHGRYRVVQDFGLLKEFCSDLCVQN